MNAKEQAKHLIEQLPEGIVRDQVVEFLEFLQEKQRKTEQAMRAMAELPEDDEPTTAEDIRPSVRPARRSPVARWCPSRKSSGSSGSDRLVYHVRQAGPARLEEARPPDRCRDIKAVHQLAGEYDQAGRPMQPDVKRMPGTTNEWRLRVGDYRVIFEPNAGALVVLVLRAGHRREVYCG